MHPEVVTARPGDCPICGMALVSWAPVSASARGTKDTVGAFPGWSWNDTAIRLGLQVPTARPMWGAPMAPASVDGSGAVVASLYKDEIAGLAGDETGQFVPVGAPDAGVVVRRAPSPEPAPADRRAVTAPVWFRRADAGERLVPGTAGWLKLAAKPRQVLLAPATAVLDGADGPYVLVAARGSHAITRRAIEIGRVFGGSAAVMSGLQPTDRLVTVGAFFMDEELRARDRGTAARAN
jgi:hypothetical protein